MFAFYYAKDVAASGFGQLGEAQVHTNMKKRLLQIAGGFFGIFVCLKAYSLLSGAGLDPAYLKGFQFWNVYLLQYKLATASVRVQRNARFRGQQYVHPAIVMDVA